MEPSDLFKKVRAIEIKTRGLSQQVFSGEYHSAFKGRGMAFSEVREYMPGDDVRAIDWNVTARFNKPFIKIFEEERELTVMLLVDVSASQQFGSRSQTKQELLAELCAVLAFSAIQNNDKIGVIFFSDQVEKFIAPKKGRKHILRIIRELLDFEPAHTGTNIGEGLRYLTNVIKKRCTAFVISDFLGTDFDTPLRIANKKHDVVALQVADEREFEMPRMGLVPFSDAETGQTRWINTSSKSVRERYRKHAIRRQGALNDQFRRQGIDHVRIHTGDSYVKPLVNLFKRREGRR